MNEQELLVRMMKLEATIEGMFHLLAKHGSEMEQGKALLSELIVKHNIINKYVIELKAKKEEKDEDTTED